MQHSRIGCLYRFEEIGMTHITTIDKEELLCPTGGILWFDHKATNRDQFCLRFDIHEIGSIYIALGITKDCFYPLLLCTDG